MKPYTFDQIAGYTQEKNSLRDVCGLLKNADKLTEMGVRLPSGILLIGDPGVGKTVMAEALIAESGLACERLDIAVCDENDTPLASYLADLADRVKSKAPCILFADELDKLLGREGYRGSTYDMADSRAFLRMLDSLRGNSVTVLAIVNDEDMLSPAIRRSGRFDRIIRIGLPECRDRGEILRHYAKSMPMAPHIDYQLLAMDTAGLSGADIESIMNDAGLNAASHKRKRINMSDIEYALDRKRNQEMEHEAFLNEDSLHIVATHEIGHAVAALALCPDDLRSVTLRPRGNSLGHAKMTGKEDSMTSKSDLEAKIAVIVAGRAAEESFFPGDRYAGAGDDLIQAYNMVSKMVTQEGLYGLQNLAPEMGKPFGNYPVSEEKLRSCENMIQMLLDEAMSKATAILTENRFLVSLLVDSLMNDREKTLSGNRIKQIANDCGSKLVLKRDIA